MADHQHLHDAIRAIGIDKDPGGFMRAYFEHVRDYHGHDVTSTTPWERVQNLHREDHR